MASWRSFSGRRPGKNDMEVKMGLILMKTWDSRAKLQNNK